MAEGSAAPGIHARAHDGFRRSASGERIVPFMQASAANPQAMILGVPASTSTPPPSASAAAGSPTGRPTSRRCGAGSRTPWHHVSCASTHRTTRRGDGANTVDASGYDFDAEAVVRLSWGGTRALNRPVPVRYFAAAEGGVSHFNYWRDNIPLTSMYFRLLPGFILSLPRIVGRQQRRAR